jgi:hypothetical protein
MVKNNEISFGIYQTPRQRIVGWYLGGLLNGSQLTLGLLVAMLKGN